MVSLMVVTNLTNFQILSILLSQNNWDDKHASEVKRCAIKRERKSERFGDGGVFIHHLQHENIDEDKQSETNCPLG